MARPRATSRADEFRGDEERHRRAEAFAVVGAFLRDVEHCLTAEIFALGDVDHFLGDDALARPFELGDGVLAAGGSLFSSPLWGGVRGGGREVSRDRRGVLCTRLHGGLPLPTPHPTLPHKGGGRRRAHRARRVGEIPGEMLAGDVAVVDRLDRAAVILLDAAALTHPSDARARKALLDVDWRVGLGIDAGGVIDPHRLLAGALRQRDLAQRHAQLGRRVGRRINFSRAGNRAGGHRRRGEIGFGERLVHRSLHFIAARSDRDRARERSRTGEWGRISAEVSVPSPA